MTKGPLEADEPGVELVVAPDSGAPTEPESYVLQVGRKRVSIISADQRGAIYGLLTLLELVQRAPNGGNIFLAAKFDDAPDFPFRGVYPVPSYPGAPIGFHKLIDQMVRLRYNAACFDVDAFKFDVYRDPEKLRRIEDQVAYCRKMGIEPIPVLQSYGHSSRQLGIDPNIAEGMEVVDEKLVLVGTEPVALAHPNVIRTESSDVHITDAAGGRTFMEGHDYEVSGKTEITNWRVGYSSKAPPFKIRRTPGSRIPDGATVLAGYDYVAHVDKGGNCAYCPNEPRLYRIMGEAIRNTIRTFHPKYLHIGHDEISHMGTDSRCRKSGRSNAENLALEIWRLYRIAKDEDPNIRLMMWDDMINPYTHGRLDNYGPDLNSRPDFQHHRHLIKDPTSPTADLLPRDVIQNLWFHNRTAPLTAGLKSLEFFGKKGPLPEGMRIVPACAAGLWRVSVSRMRGCPASAFSTRPGPTIITPSRKRRTRPGEFRRARN